jgi:hypothetical protein
MSKEKYLNSNNHSYYWEMQALLQRKLGTSIQLSYNTNHVVLSDNFYSSKYTIQYLQNRHRINVISDATHQFRQEWLKAYLLAG